MGRSGALVEISDPRPGDRYLRASWHAGRRVVVISQWRDGVCVATTPVGLSDIPRLVELLVRALHEAARESATTAQPTVASLRRDAVAILRGWLRPKLAPVVDMAATPAGTRARPASEDIRETRPAGGPSPSS